jgi:hypothetical protein
VIDAAMTGGPMFRGKRPEIAPRWITILKERIFRRAIEDSERHRSALSRDLHFVW